MSKHRSSTSIELEIQVLLKHYGEADLAADALIKKYEKQKLSLSEFETISSFLLHARFYGTLTHFILRKLDDPSKIPWGHFLEALSRTVPAIDTNLQQALIEGAEEDRALTHLARSHALDRENPELPRQRTLRRSAFQERHRMKRQEILQELEVLKSQGLYSDEEKALTKLSQLFPEDTEVLTLKTALRERLALDIIAKRPSSQATTYIPAREEKDPETTAILKKIENSMHNFLDQEKKDKESMARNFAIAHMLWENEDAAVSFLDRIQNQTPADDWLRAELLLRGRRFLELLDLLVNLQQKYATDPEVVFSSNYLKAQALWGLNQRSQAIEILEGLMQARPQYRSAHALLDEWREESF